MYEELERGLGYHFQNQALLENALTHSSYANEHHLGSISSNERLEFLGDAVLGVVVADYLYLHFPDMPEEFFPKPPVPGDYIYYSDPREYLFRPKPPDSSNKQITFPAKTIPQKRGHRNAISLYHQTVPINTFVLSFCTSCF